MANIRFKGDSPVAKYFDLLQLEPHANKVNMDPETWELMINGLPFSQFCFYYKTPTDSLPEEKKYKTVGTIPEGYPLKGTMARTYIDDNLAE